jgi:hypothetical protein
MLRLSMHCQAHDTSFRYGLVVRIAGSHPAGPGSIPGNGKLFSLLCACPSVVGIALSFSGEENAIIEQNFRRGWDSNPRGQSPLD